MGGVKNHYERWPFPGRDFISREGLLLLRYMQKWLETPVRDGRSVRVLDVGCGTGHTTLSLARHFPDVEFIGIDVSETSLESARREAGRESGLNVKFEYADVTEGLSKLGEFEIVLCLGVLHHIRSLEDNFQHIVSPLREGGYLILWFYGRYGRASHVLNQLFIQTLAGKRSGTERFEIARTFLEELGPRFAADSGFYTPKGSGEEGIDWLMDNPQWLADQMIPVFEQSVTMQEILRLLDDNGLEFVQWLGVQIHLSEYTDSKTLLQLFDKLTFRQQLVAIDYLIKPEYYFLVGRRSHLRE